MSAPSIGPAPPESPQTTDTGSVFNAKAIASWNWLTTFFSNLQAVVDWIDTRVQAAFDAGLEDAADNATAAQQSASFAGQEAGRARDERQATELVRDETGALRDSAAGHAADAASYTENAAISTTLKTITEDTTIGGGKNALSVGDIEVADGVTVTVEPGHTWSIV